MTQRKKRRPAVPPIFTKPGKTSPDARLVAVDDGPMRKRAANDLNHALAKLDKARAELLLFEQEDGPAFSRWLAQSFGPLLTELRENARLLNEQQELIEQVEIEMMLSGGRSPRKAYAEVMKRRTSPVPDDGQPSADDPSSSADDAAEDEDDGPEPFGPFGKGAAEVPESERRAMFDDFLQTVLGIFPDDMTPREYAKMFAEFDENFFGGSAEQQPAGPRPPAEPGTDPDAARIKEIYRILVRQLHPDTMAADDRNAAAIWHEVQEAYKARNLDRLETLLALTEVQRDKGGRSSSLSHMQAALVQLNRGLKAIQRSIREAKRNPAWRFSRIENRQPLMNRVQAELDEDLSLQRMQMAEFKRILDDWSRPLERAPRKPRKKAAPPKRKTKW